jgi:hypothetical protein
MTLIIIDYFNPDSTKTITDIHWWLNTWLSPVIILTIIGLIFAAIKQIIFRKETKPHLTNAKVNISNQSTLSFTIANHRPYSISLQRLYYRIFYFGFIPFRKLTFRYPWDYPSDINNPKIKITTIEKEQEFIIPLANDEPVLKRKCKIYAKTTGGLCKGTSHARIHKLVERLEKESKFKR